MRVVLKTSLLLIALVLSGCNQIKMNSYWNEGTITIDGNLGEWTEGLTILPDSKLAIGTRNDGENFYLALTTKDQDLIRQVIMTGFTLWLDPKGGRKRILGIGYPQPARPERSLPQPGKKKVDPAAQAELMRTRLLAQTEILIMFDDGSITRLGKQNPQGIGLAVRLAAGILHYELRVPLSTDENNRRAIHSTPGRNIGVGLTTTKPGPPRQGGSGESGNDIGGDFRGSGGSGRGAGTGGERPGMASTQNFEPLKIWLKVKLSEK